MRKKKKLSSLFQLMSIMAISWVMFGGRWQYLNDKGEFVKNQWVNDTYWFDENGYLQYNQWVDGGKYFVTAFGAKARDTWVNDNAYVNKEGLVK